jgi:maltose alpha-D-glucosyltransferase/alpha-amylase
MVQQFVEAQADGWTHAINELGRYYEHVNDARLPEEPLPRTLSAAVSATPSHEIADLIGAYLTTAATLGRRTAEMHLALASDTSDPTFAPEPFTAEDFGRLTADITAQATRALRAIETGMDRLPADVAARVGELLNSRDTLLERFRSTPAPADIDASRIRVHGDYHLGQVLWAEGDFYILDFEGEPARPFSERRRKESPLKDVAGMLRSFSYAAYAGLFAHTSLRPADLGRLEPWARIWQTWTMGAFFRAYLTAAKGAQFLPAAPHQRRTLLQLFTLDKALYELNYELNNRPDWVRIPLWGVLELLDAER